MQRDKKSPYLAPILILVLTSLISCSKNDNSSSIEKDFELLIVRCAADPWFNTKFKLNTESIEPKEYLAKSYFHNTISCDCFGDILEKQSSIKRDSAKERVIKEVFSKCRKKETD